MRRWCASTRQRTCRAARKRLQQRERITTLRDVPGESCGSIEHDTSPMNAGSESNMRVDAMAAIGAKLDAICRYAAPAPCCTGLPQAQNELPGTGVKAVTTASTMTWS